MFDSIKAINDIQKLKSGNIVYLSDAQIVSCIINLSDAKKRLSESSFQELYSLFNNYKKSKEKKATTLSSYFERCFDIIYEFEKIAPYDYYCGDNSNDTIIAIREIQNRDEQTANRIVDKYINIINGIITNKELVCQENFSMPIYYIYTINYLLFITLMCHKTFGYSKTIMDIAYQSFVDIITNYISANYKNLDLQIIPVEIFTMPFVISEIHCLVFAMDTL